MTNLSVVARRSKLPQQDPVGLVSKDTGLAFDGDISTVVVSTSIKNKVEVEAMKTKCEQCGVEFDARPADLKRGRARFCSLSCTAKHGNSLRSSGKIVVCCATCGKELERIPSQVKRCKNNFCDKKCKRDFEFTGVERQKRQTKNRREHMIKKDELLTKFGIVCQHPSGCDLDLKGDRRMVDMHHFGDDPLDHDKTLLLCPYHHRIADLGV